MIEIIKWLDKGVSSRLRQKTSSGQMLPCMEHLVVSDH